MQTLNPTDNDSLSNLERWMVVFTIMLVATLEVLDSTIVNVALGNIMGALGASSDQITWVLTAYIVASAIFMPLTGFMVARLGRKRLLLTNIIGFMASSMICGLSNSLSMLVIFRFFQGAFGASLIPLSQAILRDTFPPTEQGKAMAIWGIGIMAAPVIGPSLGGFITEVSSWRWIFYLNIPICAFSLLLAFMFVKETPLESRRLDWIALLSMATGIGCLQLFLDQGNQKGWDSNFIVSLTIISIIGITVFIIRSLNTSEILINIRLFFDNNFRRSTLALAIFSGAMFAGLTLQPLMMVTLFNYSTLNTGIVMAPRGIASAIGMAMVPGLLKHFGSKPLLIVGVLLSIYGNYLMCRLNLNADMLALSLPGIYQGFGMGLFFVPLSANAMVNLPPSANSEASGLFSYGRMLGTSIGISIFSTVVSRQSQANWNRLGGHLNPFNHNVVHWFKAQNFSMQDPFALTLLQNELERQARMLAFIDSFWAITLAFIILLPLILSLSSNKSASINLEH